MVPFELRQLGIVISSIACALVQPACGSESQPSSPAEGGRAGIGGSAGTTLDAGVDASAGSGGSGGSAGDGGIDSGAETGGSPGCRDFVMPSDCTIPVNAVLPGELRCTGLYGDWPKRELACGISGFKPAFELWSDGAEKHRYVYLPPGTQVDVTSADAFVFPVGTQFWKEFRVPVDGGFRLGETRLLRKSDLGWIYTSYVWSVDGQTAVQTNDGVADLHGSGHTVPTRDQCKDCHVGRTDFILGWDFLLLGRGATGLTRDELHRRGLLVASGAPAPAPTAEIPGDDVERTALGYLHANCGVSCHNDTAEARGKPSGLFLRLESGDLGSVATTDAVTTGVNRTPSPNAETGGLRTPEAGQYYDFRPLDIERSLSVARMDMRGTAAQMPRIATNRVDQAGVNAIEAWVNHMTRERGYPAPAP